MDQATCGVCGGAVMWIEAEEKYRHMLAYDGDEHPAWPDDDEEQRAAAAEVASTTVGGVRIFVDGVEVTDVCVEAASTNGVGYALCYEQDERGRHVRDELGGLKKVTLSGKVEIRFPKAGE